MIWFFVSVEMNVPIASSAPACSKQSEIADHERLPVRIAVLEKEREIQGGEQQQAGVENHSRQPLSDNDFQIADRAKSPAIRSCRCASLPRTAAS